MTNGEVAGPPVELAPPEVQARRERQKFVREEGKTGRFQFFREKSPQEREAEIRTRQERIQRKQEEVQLRTRELESRRAERRIQQEQRAIRRQQFEESGVGRFLSQVGERAKREISKRTGPQRRATDRMIVGSGARARIVRTTGPAQVVRTTGPAEIRIIQQRRTPTIRGTQRAPITRKRRKQRQDDLFDDPFEDLI